MMARLIAFKFKLARVRKSARRFRFVQGIWGERKASRAKACVFYWVMMPTSAVAYAVVGVFYAGYVVLGGIFGTLAGFMPNLKGELDDGNGMFHGYKYNPITKRRGKVAPWEILVPVAAIVALIVWRSEIIDWLIEALPFFGAFAAAAAALGLIGWVITRNQEPIVRGWNRICPDLEVVDNGVSPNGQHAESRESV